MIERLLFVGLVLAPCAHAVGAAHLGELLAAAERSNLELQQAITNTRKAEENHSATRAKFLPTLALQSSFGYDWQPSLRDTQSLSSSAALVSKWSLYDNGNSWREYEVRGLEVERARKEEKLIRERVTYEVLTRASRWLLAHRQYEISERKLRTLREQFRTTERLYRQGLSTIRDYQRLQTEVDRGVLAVLRYQDDMKDSLEELHRFLGQTEGGVDKFELKGLSASSMLKVLTDAQVSKNFVEERDPQVVVARTSLEISRIRSEDARRPLWPVVDLFAQAGYGSDDFVEPSQRWSDRERVFSGARLQLSWQLFDWGANRSQHRNSVLDEKMSERSQAQALLNARAALEKQRRQRDRQAKSVEIARKIFDIEAKTYTNIQKDYRAGQASYLDFITSLNRQAQAEIELEEEIVAYYLTLAESLRQIGELHGSLSQ